MTLGKVLLMLKISEVITTGPRKVKMHKKKKQ